LNWHQTPELDDFRARRLTFCTRPHVPSEAEALDSPGLRPGGRPKGSSTERRIGWSEMAFLINESAREGHRQG
jgi:hypothetical protein